MLAFGSCNRQTKPQDFWKTIDSVKPSHYLWVGDAVYAKGSSIEKLQAAYRNLTSNPIYADFADNVLVNGAWDDHDFGINDAGKHVPNLAERAQLYLQFLQFKNDFDELELDHDGVYHSLLVDVNGAKVKVIFLDTRTFRDHHWIRSFGEFPMKGSALVASAIRGAYSTLGMARQYAGEMLGQKQWDWLERTLRASEEEGVVANIVVSSIQVLTTNPVFESWGHFPVEKRRLFDLLRRLDPRGLVLLSGDVHLAEISEASYSRADGSTGTWTEVTSSGLTHTCADGLATGVLCPTMMALFSQHRRMGAPSLYLGRNFGTIAAHPLSSTSKGGTDRYEVEFSIRSVSDASVVLSHRVATSAQRPLSPIVSVAYPDYRQVPPVVSVTVLLALLGLLLRAWLGRKSHRRGREQGQDEEKKHW